MLKRDIKRWDLVLLMINCIVGAGIFGLPSKIYAQAGLYSAPAIGICALLMLVVILNFSEVASRFDKTGGPYLYATEAFGKFSGFLIGWLALASRIAVYAALINLMADYLSYLSDAFRKPGLRSLSIVAFTALIFLINYRGVRDSSRLNNLLAVAKLIPLFLFVAVGFFFIDPDRLDFSQAPPDVGALSTVILVLVFAFTGFEGAVINAGEMSNPGKDIPFALIVSTLFVAVFYTLIQIVCIGAYPGLAGSDKPIADAAHRFMGAGGGLLITAGAIVSIGGTLNANLLAGSRLPYAFSEEGRFLPRAFSKTHAASGVPWFSLIVYTLAALLVSLSGTFIYAVSISVITKVLIFAIISAALIKFRLELGRPAPVFRLRYGYFSAILGLGICIWLLYASDLDDFGDVAAVMAAGLAVYLLGRAKRRR